MKCKYHPKRQAEFFCASCNVPLCKECAEESKSGEYYCFQCAMLHSVSEGVTSIKNKLDEITEKKTDRKKQWGPFKYFVIISSVLILVMWGVIILGGQPAPSQRIDFAKKGRVLLFMVDGAIKRYAHYEGNKYPKTLLNLVPKYLSLGKDQLFYLEKLSYKTDPRIGYRLSVANPKAGEMNVILTPKGIEYTQPSSGGA